MAFNLAQKFVSLGMPAPLAKEYASQVGTGLYNWKRLEALSMIPRLAKYLADSLARETFDPDAASELGMMPEQAKLTQASRGTYNAQALALFAKLPVGVSNSRKTAANTLFQSLSSAGALSNIDYMLLPIGEAGDEDNNLVDWIGSREASTVNAPVYSGFGWSGDGVTQFVETGVAHNTFPHYLQNDAYMASVVLTNVANNTQFDAGFSAPTTYLCGRSSTDTLLVRANATGGSVISYALPSATSVGVSWFTRRSVTDVYIGKNASVSALLSQTSSTLGTSTVTLMKSGTGYSTRKCSGLVVGGGITPEVGQQIGQALVTYYAALGIAL